MSKTFLFCVPMWASCWNSESLGYALVRIYFTRNPKTIDQSISSREAKSPGQRIFLLESQKSEGLGKSREKVRSGQRKSMGGQEVKIQKSTSFFCILCVRFCSTKARLRLLRGSQSILRTLDRRTQRSQGVWSNASPSSASPSSFSWLALACHAPPPPHPLPRFRSVLFDTCSASKI